MFRNTLGVLAVFLVLQLTIARPQDGISTGVSSIDPEPTTVTEVPPTDLTSSTADPPIDSTSSTADPPIDSTSTTADPPSTTADPPTDPTTVPDSTHSSTGDNTMTTLKHSTPGHEFPTPNNNDSSDSFGSDSVETIEIILINESDPYDWPPIF